MRSSRLAPPLGYPGVRQLSLDALEALVRARGRMPVPAGADLVVVSSPDDARSVLIATTVVRAGYAVVEIRPEAADGYLRQRQPRAVLLDVAHLAPEAAGALVRALRPTSVRPLIAVVSPADTEIGVAVLDAGADDFLRWPLDLRDVQARLRLHLRLRWPRPTALGATDRPVTP